MSRQEIASANVGRHSSGGRGKSTPTETHSGRSTPKKKPVNSCRKGKEGEREFTHALTEAGFPAICGQQHAGDKLPVLAHRWNGQSTWWIRVLPLGYRAPYWQTLQEFLVDIAESGRVDS